MPLFNAPVVPWFLGHRELLSGQTAGASVRTAQGTYIFDVENPAYCVVTGFTIDHGGVAAGNLDLGIYDQNGTLLVHTGVIAAAPVNLPQKPVLGSPFLLAPGRYSFAFWTDSATDTYFARTGVNVGAWGNFRTSHNLNAGGLLASFAAMGGADPAGIFVPFLANLQGTGF